MLIRIAGLAGLLALAACGGDGGETGQLTSQNLEGTEWMLLSIGEQPVVPDSQASLSFSEPGVAVGHGSCNRFRGQVSVSGDEISFSNLASTRMACQPDIDLQEMNYQQALADATHFRMTGSYLEIDTENPSSQLRFEQTSSSP